MDRHRTTFPFDTARPPKKASVAHLSQDVHPASLVVAFAAYLWRLQTKIAHVASASPLNRQRPAWPCEVPAATAGHADFEVALICDPGATPPACSGRMALPGSADVCRGCALDQGDLRDVADLTCAG